MKNPIGEVEAAAIEQAIAALEARTGIEVVAAVVPRSDAYPEAPWRAFALAASISALLVLVADISRPDWLTPRALLLQALVILGSGAAAAFAAEVWPAVTRIFIGKRRMRREVRQYAEVLFLTRELFRTPARNAVLVLVSLFEHRVVIVPDAFHRGRIEHAEWETVVDRMTPFLRLGRGADAFLEGLEALEALFADKGIGKEGGPNVLPDALVRGEAP